MKRINVNICALLVLALAACTKSDVVDSVPTPSNTITFSAADMQLEVISRGGDRKPSTLDITNKAIASEDGEVALPMVVKVEEGIHRAIEQKPATRAAAVTDASEISMLRAWASAKNSAGYKWHINGVDFKRGNDDIFRSIESYLWLDAQTKLDFFVVANHIDAFTPNFNAARDHIDSFDYTVPAEAANQPDLLVAENLGVAGNYEQSVPLDFKHVLAAVNIKVGSVVSGTIKSIKFKGVYNKGTYLLDEHQWVNRTIEDNVQDNVEGNVVFNVPLPEGGVAITKGEYTGDAVINTTSFMMIPQQLATGAEVEIEFYDSELNKNVTLRASIQGDVWAMNTTTNYLININGDYGLEIIPLDKVIDSHYVITKVVISSEYPGWTLSAVANDGADVTVQLESEVNPMAKQGFWTDKEARMEIINEKPTYIIDQDAESARGYVSCGGTSGGGQIVYVFIPENVSGADRKIELTLKGYNDNYVQQASKQLTLTQHSVKWLDPTGDRNEDLYWGCELLIEGNPVDWGFCWDGIEEKYITTQGNQEQVPPGQLKHVEERLTAAGFNIDVFHDPNYYINLVQKSNNNTGWLLRIDYSKIGNIEIAGSRTEGYDNTLELYNFDGISILASLKEFIANQDNIQYTLDSGEANITNTLDFAAMYAMKRNRFHLYNDGQGWYLPIIEEKDINWYLPAMEQFHTIMQSNWGQEFTWNDSYWTSTAYLTDTETDNAHSYAFINGIETIAHRTSPYLAMALRRKTNTADIVIKPEDVVIPGAGENGSSGSGGTTGGDTGGDQNGNT